MSKIHLPIAELKPALAGLGKIISKSASLPVLRTVRVDRTKDGWITLTGTDLDAFVTVRLEEPSTGEPASILVPFEDLAKTAKGCSAGETITVEQASKDSVILHYPVGQQFAQIKVETCAGDEFPPIPRIKGELVPLNDNIRTSLLEAFDCASTDDLRHILQGAYIDVSDKKCNQVVATDGRHLYSSNSFSLPLSESIIIPTNKFLGWKEFNADGEWQLRVDPKKKDQAGFVQISSRRWRFIHRQIEGPYPNYRAVIPTQFKTTVILNKEVATLVPRIPCDIKNPNKPIGLKIEKNRFCLLGRNAGEEKFTEVEMEGVEIKGPAVTIYLNRDLLVKVLQFEFNKLEIVDELTAMKFSNAGKQIIVMPVRAGDPSPPPTTPAAKPSPPPTQEPTGKDEVSPVNSEPSTERSTTMPRNTTPTNGNGNGTNGHHNEEPQPATIDTALEQIETVKGSYREAIRGLTTLTDTLKQVQRDQKTSAKDIQSVRSTLEKLQAVRI